MNFYREAAGIIEQLSERKGTVKSLVLGHKVKDKKRMYGIVCETLKYKAVLEEVMDGIQLFQMEKKFQRSLALVLCHDLILAKRGPPKSILSAPAAAPVVRHKARLLAELARLKIRRGATETEDLLPQDIKDAVTIPRYIRVNTLKTTPDAVIKHFTDQKYRLVEDWSLLTPRSKTIMRDENLPELLILPVGSDLHADKLYLKGDIILQDKASCFPSFVLNPPPGAHVIDACAAPGNKTSHVVARMRNKGKVWAFDLDSRRLDLLKRMTTKAGCAIIDPKHGSFLDADPNDEVFSKVEYILLDPSCSGSGIISRLDHLAEAASSVEYESLEAENEAKAGRLASLAEFQLSVIKHAFLFPAVKKVVYSTCSIHTEENEAVVEAALQANPDFVLAPRSAVLTHWTNRGNDETSLSSEQAESLIRADPKTDRTNGFFVACFRRSSHPVESLNPPTETINTPGAKKLLAIHDAHTVDKSTLSVPVKAPRVVTSAKAPTIKYRPAARPTPYVKPVQSIPTLSLPCGPIKATHKAPGSERTYVTLSKRARAKLVKKP